RTFSPLYRGLIAAGTETGRLPDVLARLADYLDARLALRQKFVVALIYPALVTVIAIGVIAVLVTYVVPQVVSVYQQSRQTLPLLTQALIATSDFLRATGWLWLAFRVIRAVGFLGPVVLVRGWCFHRGVAARAHAGAYPCGAVARACCGASGGEPRHGAVCEHARDPRRQRRAAIAFARGGVRRRANDSARARGAHGRGPRSRGRVAVARAQGTKGVSAGPDPSGRERRAKRGARADARAGGGGA